MPTYTYTGTSHSLRIGKRTLLPGRATELEGKEAEGAAAYAAKHPELLQVEADGKPARTQSNSGAAPSNALAERQALVARAKELGIPAKGKSAELSAAIAAAESSKSDLVAEATALGIPASGTKTELAAAIAAVEPPATPGE